MSPRGCGGSRGGGYNGRLIQISGSGKIFELEDAVDADKDRHYGEDSNVGGEAFLAFRGMGSLEGLGERRLHRDGYAHVYPDFLGRKQGFMWATLLTKRVIYED